MFFCARWERKKYGHANEAAVEKNIIINNNALWITSYVIEYCKSEKNVWQGTGDNQPRVNQPMSELISMWL